MKGMYKYIVLLFVSILFSCSSDVEYGSISTESELKELLAGTNGKIWVLNTSIQDCNSNTIGASQDIIIYPSGQLMVASNQCTWSVRIEKSPVHFQAYLILGTKVYKILPYAYNNSFYILDEMSNQYLMMATNTVRL